MYAVFVSFHFQPPSEPSEDTVAAHQALLDKHPRLCSASALQRRYEYAFFLVFRKQEDIDTYLECPEFRRFRSSDGCYDVFVKVFDLVASTDTPYFDMPAAAAAQQFEITPI